MEKVSKFPEEYRLSVYWKKFPGVKTRKDGTVIISPVKDSWTREEVSVLIGKAMSDVLINASARLDDKSIPWITIEGWIEQNL